MTTVKHILLGFIPVAIGVAVIFRVAPLRKLITGMAQ
jgi:hypothetical protein